MYSLLLTACINPNGMPFTKVSDKEVRLQQYRKALDFYLSNTNYPIVFCENSNTDISNYYPEAIANRRLEVLTFSGNDQKKKGKGYGEACIIEYAINHSRLIKPSSLVVKVTGRLIVENISDILNYSFPLQQKNSVVCNFNSDFSFPDSRIFVCPISFLCSFIQDKEKINDYMNLFFEHLLAQHILRGAYPYAPFWIEPTIIGISGTTGKIYQKTPPSTAHDFLYKQMAFSRYQTYMKIMNKSIIFLKILYSLFYIKHFLSSKKNHIHNLLRYQSCRIIYDKEGQLCNRFWSYLSSVLWAIENKKRIYILFWDSQIDDFEKLSHNKYISFPFRNWLWKIKIFSIYPMRIIVHRVFHSILFHKFVESGKAMRYGFIKGWGSCTPDYCLSMYNNESAMKQIKLIFSPNRDIKETVDHLFRKQREKKSIIIIGIHIRRGDYKEWCQGKYYYSDEEYIRIMKHLQNSFNEPVQFFCASNEPISANIIKEFTPFYIPNGSAAHDLYGLSISDYIIGPPSTFSQWASFYGRIPLYLIEDPSFMPERKDFSYIYALDHFTNGRIMKIPED